MGEYLADGFPRGIASSGTLVFVADQPNGLVIVDVTAPTTPEVVAVLSLGSDPNTRVIVPDQTPAGQSEPPIACIVSNQAGLQVIDLSDPKSPRVAAPVATRGQPRSVAMQNNQVYVISENTLEVFDLSNPGLPVLLASQSVSDQATQVAANEELLFVATPREADGGEERADRARPLEREGAEDGEALHVAHEDRDRRGPPLEAARAAVQQPHESADSENEQQHTRR